MQFSFVTKFLAGIALATCTMGLAVGGKSLSQNQATSHLQSGPLKGKVVTPEGKPAPNARVSFAGHKDSQWVVSSETHSDSNGEFVFASPDWPMVEAGAVFLIAESESFGIAIERAHNWKNDNAIKLKKPTELRVQFVQVDGKPIAGVTFQLKVVVHRDGESFSGGLLPDSIAKRYSGITQSNGEVVIFGLPQGASIDLSHDSADFAKLRYDQRIQLTIMVATQAQPITLQAAAKLSGRVTFSGTGEAVVGVPVHAQEAHGSDGSGGSGWGMVVTDKDGNFTIGQLTRGNYNVNADLGTKWGQDWASVAYDSTPIKPGQSKSGMNIKLIKGGLIVGVVKFSDGKPIINTHVGVYGPARPQSGAWVQNTLTDKDGKYSLRVPPGVNHVYLQGGPGMPEGMSHKAHDLTVVEGKQVTKDFVVEK